MRAKCGGGFSEVLPEGKNKRTHLERETAYGAGPPSCAAQGQRRVSVRMRVGPAPALFSNPGIALAGTTTPFLLARVGVGSRQGCLRAISMRPAVPDRCWPWLLIFRSETLSSGRSGLWVLSVALNIWPSI